MPKLVCVFAHPDDESFGAGGSIAVLSKTYEVHVICCTDGNHQGKNLKNIRNSELAQASAELGIHKTHQLSFEDGYLCNANYHELAAEVRSILDDLQPEIVLTFDPNGLSGHLDHIAVTSVVNYLFTRLSYVKEIWYLTRLAENMPNDQYFVYRPNGHPRSQIDKVIDISSVFETKIKAMKKHVSQSEDCERLIKRMESEPKEEYFLVRSKSD